MVALMDKQENLIHRYPFRCVDYRCRKTVYWWNHFHVLPFIGKSTAPCGHEWDCIIYAEEFMENKTTPTFTKQEWIALRDRLGKALYEADLRQSEPHFQRDALRWEELAEISKEPRRKNAEAVYFRLQFEGLV